MQQILSTPGVEPAPTLPELGVERLTLLQMQDIAVKFGEHIKAGLAGSPSSMPVIPTYLQPTDKEKLHVGDISIVVEVGGTNVRAGIIELDGEKNPQLLAEKSVPLSEEKHKKYTSVNEFFDEVAADVAPVISDRTPQAVGIIWSFPAEVFGSEDGIDAISTTNFSKELVIPDADRAPVGVLLVDALRRNGIDIPHDIPRAVANDTAAVLLASGGSLGGIVGTGFNFAFSHNGEMYNLEAGQFSGVPTTTLIQEVDKASERPGHYPAEKQISGDYVGKTFTMALQKLGLAEKEYTAADMSAILDGSDMASNDVIQRIAEDLRDRSAQIVASMVVGTITAFPEDFPQDEIIIPIDGSFFGKTPGYKEAVSLYTAQLVENKKVTFVHVHQSGMKGAGLAALSVASNS